MDYDDVLRSWAQPKMEVVRF